LHQIASILAVRKVPTEKLISSLFVLGKGHSQAALSLWNNMFEPVGGKQWAWHMGETLKCPSEQYPYIFTNKNSAKALAELPPSTTMNPKTSRASSVSSSQPHVSTTKRHKKHKHHKSDSQFSNLHLAAFAGVFFVIILLLIVVACKRQQIRIFFHRAGRRHIKGFTNPEYADDSDDVEIWNRSNTKSNFSLNNDVPKTHGARISFE
jgi:hypothetical protein